MGIENQLVIICDKLVVKLLEVTFKHVLSSPQLPERRYAVGGKLIATIESV